MEAPRALQPVAGLGLFFVVVVFFKRTMKFCLAPQRRRAGVIAASFSLAALQGPEQEGDWANGTQRAGR